MIPEFGDRLPPLVGLHLLIVSHGLEQPFDRARGLETSGYRTTACPDPKRAVEHLAISHAEAVVIDLGIGGSYPEEIAARVRQADESIPIVVVGHAGTMAEMLRCFEAGADDYCRPRCPTEEIDLRLRALLRRTGRRNNDDSETNEILVVGDIEIDRVAQVVRKRGVLVSLSPTEYRLLVTMASHQGQVIPSKVLIARVWGNQCADESHYLRLYVRYLRQKLEDDPSSPQYLVNRWGAGYTFEAPVVKAA